MQIYNEKELVQQNEIQNVQFKEEKSTEKFYVGLVFREKNGEG